jgi:hypothetical protein
MDVVRFGKYVFGTFGPLLFGQTLHPNISILSFFRPAMAPDDGSLFMAHVSGGQFFFVLLAFLCATELSELSLRFSPPVLCCCVHQCRATAMGRVSKDVDSERAQREGLEVNEMEAKSRVTLCF